MDDDATERGILGSLLLYPEQYLKPVLSSGLRVDHFHTPFHAQVFQAIVEISDTGAIPDLNLVAAKVGSPVELDHLTAEAPAMGNVLPYAATVVENHRWRQIKNAGHLLVTAGENKDKTLEVQADELLTAPAEGEVHSYTPDQLADLLIEELEGEGEETIPFPFLSMTLTTGGYRRGEHIMLSGHSNHGKTALAIQMLTKAASAGFKAGLYINEGNPMEAGRRFAASASGISFNRLRRLPNSDLTQAEYSAYIDALGKIPFTVTDIAGWTAQEVARHIKHQDFDVVAVDHIHLFEFKDERELASISRTLNQAAKQAHCALIVLAQLNEARVMNAKRPRPTLGDIRGSGMLKNDSDITLFCYREQDSQGTLLDSGEGEIYIAKGRNTARGNVKVWYDPRSMSFSENPWL